MPFEHQLRRISIQSVSRRTKSSAGPVGTDVCIARSHIEIRTRQIAFILIIRLIDLAGMRSRRRIGLTIIGIGSDTIGSTCTEFACLAAFGSRRRCACARELAIQVRRAVVIGFTIRGIDMKSVRDHRRLLIKPTLRHRVLTVHSRTDISGTLPRDRTGTGKVTIGVDIHHMLAIRSFRIGILHDCSQIAIGNNRMTINNILQSQTKLIAGGGICRSIIGFQRGGRIDICPRNTCAQKERKEGKKMCFHVLFYGM